MSRPLHGGPFDVVIVGNGILGLSLAEALAQRAPALSLAVVGPTTRPGAATMAAGAMINVWAELAVGQLEDPAGAERAELTISGAALWDDVCAKLTHFSPVPLAVKRGTFLITNVKSADHEATALAYIRKSVGIRNVPHGIVTPDEVPGLAPRKEAAVTAILKVPDGRIAPGPVLAAYERALAAHGVRLIDDKVLMLEPGRRRLALAAGGAIAYGQVVLANGSFAQALVDQVPALKAATPRLLFGTGFALDIESAPVSSAEAVLRTVDRGGAFGVHLIPMSPGRFYAGATSTVSLLPDPVPDARAIEALKRTLAVEFNPGFEEARATLRGPGYRPTTADAMPLLGESSVPGVWFATGTKRDGFTASPYIARELARAMLGESSALPPRFRPSRPLISYKTRTAALADAVTAALGRSRQRGEPPVDPAETLARYERVYEARRLGDFGVHPELMPLYEDEAAFPHIDHPRAVP